jgi:hypothetical protein
MYGRNPLRTTRNNGFLPYIIPSGKMPRFSHDEVQD